MKQAKWIWYYGDYEIFHGNLLNSRREEKGDSYPPFMAFSSIHANVEFVKRFTIEKNDAVSRGCKRTSTGENRRLCSTLRECGIFRSRRRTLDRYD